MKILVLCALAAGAIAAGCASSPESSTEPRDERVREFTTGSNIPKRSPASQVKTYDREEFERARDTMPQGVKAGAGGGPPM